MGRRLWRLGEGKSEGRRVEGEEGERLSGEVVKGHVLFAQD